MGHAPNFRVLLLALPLLVLKLPIPFSCIPKFPLNRNKTKMYFHCLNGAAKQFINGNTFPSVIHLHNIIVFVSVVYLMDEEKKLNKRNPIRLDLIFFRPYLLKRKYASVEKERRRKWDSGGQAPGHIPNKKHNNNNTDSNPSKIPSSSLEKLSHKITASPSPSTKPNRKNPQIHDCAQPLRLCKQGCRTLWKPICVNLNYDLVGSMVRVGRRDGAWRRG